MKKSGGTLRSRATLNFLQWSLERGAADAAHLGYVPLPSSARDRHQEVLDGELQVFFVARMSAATCGADFATENPGYRFAHPGYGLQGQCHAYNGVANLIRN